MDKTETVLKMDWNDVIRYFLIIFLPLAIIVSGITIMIYRTEIKADRKFVQASEWNTVSMLQTVITHDFENIMSDLMVMIEKNELRAMLETGERTPRKALEIEFLSYAARKKLYDHIRFLDETGMEIVRVNYNRGEPYIIPENRLQFKGGRYYFADTFRLGRGEFFISPFDLNIEQGKIEKPLKPMASARQ